MSAPPEPFLTVEAYLAFEETSLERHEYYAGHIVLLAGGSEAHTLIIGNITTLLNIQLRDRPCRVYTSDMKIKVEQAQVYTYPDVTVVCGLSQFEDSTRRALLNPTVIVEVLSETTETHDRGKKFRYYRMIETLQEYLLVSQHSMHIDHYIRQNDHFWLLSSAESADDTIALPSIGCTLLLSDIYHKVSFNADQE
jgi:Uma2 family endonuclease